MLNKIKKVLSSNKEAKKTIFLIFSSIFVISVISFGLYNLFKIFAAPASIVHDTQEEFQAGNENRLITTTDPEVSINYQELPSDEHTVALWHMNEGSNDTCNGGGDVCDSSGNEIHGDFVNSAQFSSDSILGSYATSYDSTTSDYIDFGDVLDNVFTGDNFTISAWVYLDNWNASDVQTIISKIDGTGGNTDDMFQLYVTTANKLAFIVRDDSDASLSTDVDLNNDFIQNWQFITAVYNRQEKYIKLYINGELVASNVGQVDIVDEPNVRLVIGTTYGAYYPGNRRFWDGKIDEIRISDVTRTDEEIKALAQRRNYGVYTSDVLDLGAFLTSIDEIQWLESSVETGDGEVPYSSSGLIGSWKFNESSGTTANDASDQNNDGTLSNFTNTSGQDVLEKSGWTNDNKRWGNGAIMFDGTDDLVEAATTGFSGNTGSIELWFSSYWNVSYRTLATIRTSATDEMTIVFMDGAILYVDIMDRNELVIKSSVGENTWNHVVVTWNSGTVKAYFNGINTLDDTYTGTITQSNIVFGSNITKDADFYQGTIDAARLYSRVLSESEIKSNYQSGQVEFQTRTGADSTPNDGSWENWSPNDSESSMITFDGYLYKTDSSGLISYYPLNEDSGTSITDVTSSNNGTASGTYITNGKHDNARNFNGTSDFIEISDNDSLDFNNVDFSVTFWTKLAALGNTQVAVMKKEDDGEISDNETNYNIYIQGGGSCPDPNNIIFQAGNGVSNEVICSDGEINNRDWHHIVLTFDASENEVNFYINGIIDSTKSITIDPASNSYPLFLGKHASTLNNGDNFTDGIIDEVRIYNVVLGEVEVFDLYKEGSTNPEYIYSLTDNNIKIEGNSSERIEVNIPQLNSENETLALWHFDETNSDISGDDIFDETQNNNDGEINDTTTIDGISGKARYFNSTTDYIDIGNPSSLQFDDGEFTIEGWIKPDGQPSDYGFMISCYSPSASNHWYITYELDHTVKVFIQDSSSNNAEVTSTDLCLPNKWCYFSAVRENEGDTLRLYLNGIDQGNDDASSVGDIDNTSNIFIGLDSTPYIKEYYGAIDEVKISNHGKNAEEIYKAFRMGRDHILQKSVSSIDLTSKTKLPFWIASDRAGTYFEANISESDIINILPHTYTTALIRLEEDSDYCTSSVTGCINDSSANNLDGTPAGAPFTINGIRGKAWDFDGVDDHIDFTSDPINASSGSIAFWFRADNKADTSNDAFIGNRDDTSSNWEVYITKHHTNHTFIAEINGYEVLATSIPDNDFHHAAVTWGNQGGYMYFDGKLVDSISGSVIPASVESNLTIGWGYINDQYRHLNGAMDEIIITDNQLSADEIRQIYEISKRSHVITIDFQASLDSGNLITSSEDTSFTIDATTKGFSNMGDNLYEGDKIIIKENREGTEYIAQGTVTSVNESTGAVTVASWDAGSTFCTGCSPTGFTQYADVFKWQREYFDITGIMDEQLDSITNISFRILDGYEGRSIWIDDMQSGGPYLTNPNATNNITSTDQRYMQYRFIQSYDTNGINSPEISAVTVNYNEQVGSIPILYSVQAEPQDLYAGKGVLIETIYTDEDGASNLDEMYLRIENPSSTDIEYYAIEGSNNTGLTPTLISGSDYVTSITYDRTVDGNDIIILWHLETDWDWIESSNIEYGMRAIDDDENDTGWEFTDGDYSYENDLTFYGTISAVGSINGNLTSGDWVQGGETINWTGIKVVYQGTSNIYPEDSDFDVRITDDDSGIWQDTSSSGEDINIDTTSDEVEDSEDIHNIDIINVPDGGSDVSTESFTIRVDPSTPDIVDITGDDEALWQNSDSGPMISWTDPNSPSDDDFYATNDGSEPTSTNYDYTTTNSSYDLPAQSEGETTIKVRPQNNADTYGTSYSFLIRYDETGPNIETISSSSHPSEASWYTDDTPAIDWTTTDIYSGVEATWRMIDQVDTHDASYVITNGTQDIEDGNWTSGELVNGTWYFHLAGRDNVTNTSYDSFTINIDDTNPIIDTIESSSHPNQANWYVTTTAQFSWTTTDTESSVEGIWRELDQVSNHSADYVIDNGTSDNEDGDWTSSELTEGVWYFHIAVRNNSGLSNYDNFNINIDTNNPIVDSLTSSSHPNESETYTDNTPTFIWETSDTGSGVESIWRIVDQTETHDANYVVNNGTSDSEDDNWTSSELDDGIWYVHIAVRDNAGKTSYDNFKVNIDTTIPDIVDITGANEGVWQNSDSGPVISWTDPESATDDTFFITNDGSTPTNSNYTYQTSNNSYDLPDQGQGETTIKVRPQNGIGVYGITRSFIIRYDSIAPLNVSNLKGSTISTSSVKLIWDNPSSGDFSHVMIRRKTGGIPLNISDGTGVYEGSDDNYTDSNLDAGIKYYYSVYAYDLAGNYASGSAVSVWTFDGEDLEEEQEEDTLIDELTETGEGTEDVEQEEIEDKVSNILIIIDNKEIEITRETSLHAYADSEAEAKIPLSIIKEGKESLDIVQVLLISGDEVFIMKLDENQEYFTSNFKVPSQKGQYDLNVIVIYSDETTRKINLGLEIDPYGYVFSIHNENRLRIKDAKVTLYEEINNEEKMWESQDEDYPNPQYTDINGEYSFFVDPGKYKVKVDASGYKSTQTDWLDITDRTIEQDIELKREINLKSIFIIGSVSLVGIAFVSGITVLLIKKYKKRDKKIKDIKSPKISQKKE